MLTPSKARALPRTTPLALSRVSLKGDVMQNVADRSENAKPLLTPDEFCEGLRKVIGRNSIYGLIQANRIKHIKVGRKILIPRSELTDFPAREAA